MMRSANEATGVTLKAARGAGVPLGHAEDFSRAASHLIWLGDVALTEAVDALAGPHEPVVYQVADGKMTILQANPLMALPVAIDAILTGMTKVVLKKTDALLLAKAYLHVAASERGIVLQAQLHDGDIIITPASHDAVFADTPGAVDISPEVWSRFERLAALTYVPASEASRRAGAGAGLTDND